MDEMIRLPNRCKTDNFVIHQRNVNLFAASCLLKNRPMIENCLHENGFKQFLNPHNLAGNTLAYHNIFQDRSPLYHCFQFVMRTATGAPGITRQTAGQGTLKFSSGPPAQLIFPAARHPDRYIFIIPLPRRRIVGKPHPAAVFKRRLKDHSRLKWRLAGSQPSDPVNPDRL